VTRLEKARAELKAAEAEAKKAEIEAAAREAEKSLKKTDRAVWEVCRGADWPADLSAVYKALGAVRNQFALAVLGAGERLAKLNKLDPDRWSLEGKYAAEAHYYTTDDDVGHAVATWLFDIGFGRAESKDEWWTDDDRARFTETRKKAEAALGTELAALGFDAWGKGHHDT
jgi:hypothetical protein